MSVAIIEINDCGLRCSNQQGDIHISPGYALLTEQGITTGMAAQKKAYLQPQQSFNQYWRQLNLSPLPSPTQQARHHADLAYAQLLELHRESGSPEEIIFATPGSFDREQLSLVLGLAKAAPFKTLGLVDAAVAATSQANKNQGEQILHLDVQLHQMVLTRLSTSYQGEQPQVERTQVEVLTNIGLKSFYDHWARYIANQFIQQYRYDPLHTAEGEQQLYDLLPEWLAQLNGHQELAIALDSPQGSYRLSLHRNDLLGSSHEKLDQLQRKLSDFLVDGEQFIASHRIDLLPGLAEKLQPVNQLADNAAIIGCLANIETITSGDDDIHFITRLPRSILKSASTAETIPVTVPETNRSDVESNRPTTQPTHVLYQHRAQAIGDRLYIHHDPDSGGQLRFSSQQQSDTLFIRENGDLFLRASSPEITGSNPRRALQAGDIINIGTASAQLIEVS